jgi:hypothetical protein
MLHLVIKADVIDHNRRAGGRQMLGDGRTDTFRGTCDHGDMALQFL